MYKYDFSPKAIVFYRFLLENGKENPINPVNPV